MAFSQLLQKKWGSAGILFNSGASSSDICAFEESCGCLIPNDFREYLLKVNGMKENQTDEHLMRFLSLQEMSQTDIDTVGEAIEITVAEYCLYSHWYVLRFNKRDDMSRMYVTNGEIRRSIASSFRDFIIQYVQNSFAVAHLI